MDFEILHVQKGDKRKKVDTSTEEGRQAAGELVKQMMQKGTALFLERGKKTYRIKGYDPATDKLIVTVEKKGAQKDVRTSGRKAKVAAVPPVAGG